MRAWLTCGLLALLPVPAGAAEQAQDDYARGVALRAAGKSAEATAAFEQATRSRPQDADAWLALGGSYSALGQFDQAEAALNEARRLAPDYLDVQVAQARLAYFRQDIATAQARLAAVLARDPANPEATQLQAAMARARAAAGKPWRVDLSLSRGTYNRAIPDASGGAASVSRTFTGRRYAVASLDHVRQFGVQDTYYEIQGGQGAYHLALGATPQADFRPRWAARIGLGEVSRSLGGGWTGALGAEANWSRYNVGDVRGLHPVLTLAHGDALSFTARWYNTLDERDDYRSGYAVRVAWRAAPRLVLSAGWADAPESTDGRTVAVRAPSIGLSADITDDLAVRLDAVRENRQAYDRDQLILGVTRRF